MAKITVFEKQFKIDQRNVDGKEYFDIETEGEKGQWKKFTIERLKPDGKFITISGNPTPDDSRGAIQGILLLKY